MKQENKEGLHKELMRYAVGAELLAAVLIFFFTNNLIYISVIG